MDLFGSDGIQLALRWFHVTAVITWIGHAFFFNWLDRGLRPVDTRREGEQIEGELWMVHSGGFYRVEKISVAPERLPPELHWFKWEAAFAWLSGFALLVATYHHGSALLLPAGSSLSVWQGSLIGVAVLVVGWFVYDTLWASAFGSWRGAPVLAWVLIGATAWGLAQVLSGRAAYVHVGSMLGTLMVANVWRRIIPAQNALLAATRAGTSPDPELGKLAKGRSIHNNYLALPVVFIMVSNHFWGTYGHRHAWAILVLLSLAGVGLRHILNERLSRRGVPAGAACLLVAALLGAGWVMRPDDGGSADELDGVSVGAVHTDAGLPDGQGAGAPAGNGVAGDTASVVAAPRGLGSVRGTVRLLAEARSPATLQLLSECQGLHTEPVSAGDVLVRDGLLQNVFVRLVDGVDALDDLDVPPARDAPVLVDQRGCLYSPRVLGVRPGQELRFVNSDPVLHNVHAIPKRNREFNFAQPPGAGAVERSFRREEVMLQINCDVHPWMAAWVGVVPHPWFAVTDEQGAFELPDVPAGSYAVEAWHEVYGTRRADVVVQVDGVAELVFDFE